MILRVALRKRSSLEEIGSYSFSAPLRGDKLWAKGAPAEVFKVVDVVHIIGTGEAYGGHCADTQVLVERIAGDRYPLGLEVTRPTDFT